MLALVCNCSYWCLPVIGRRFLVDRANQGRRTQPIESHQSQLDRTEFIDRDAAAGGASRELVASRRCGIRTSGIVCQPSISALTWDDAECRRCGSCYPGSLERGNWLMSFTVGETVVYPNHGAAVIEDIETRQIKGEDKLYLVLRIVSQNDLVVRVPACNLDLVGVRDVVDQAGLERVFSVLRAEHTEEPTNWSRRYKANLEKLHSGDVMKVAEVVRDLWRRERERGLSAGEKRMLAKARQILVSELALAEHTNEDKAETILDEVLAS